VQVIAVSTPGRPDWRWRIVNYAGEIVEESHDGFPTIAAAVAKGAARMSLMNQIDTSSPVRVHRSTSHLRAR
jgi:hypothetical protein